MKKGKSFKELVENLEILQENEKGQLRGGFSSLPSLKTVDPPTKNKDKCNNNCTVNHCLSMPCG